MDRSSTSRPTRPAYDTRVRFVLANRLLNLAGGTEVHLVTVGAEPSARAEVVIYSPELGPFAEHARERGIAVVDELDDLPAECDVVLAQDGFVVSTSPSDIHGQPPSFGSAATSSTFSRRRKSTASWTSSSC